MQTKAGTYFQMKLIGPMPDDFVFSTSVGYLILEDVITARSISVFIECDRCPRTACKELEKTVLAGF